MNIRVAEFKDIDALAELFDQYRIFYEKDSDKEGAKKFLSERITQKDSVIYIAVDKDDTIVGFTQLYPLFSSTRMRRLWLLNDLFVLPTYRGKGISILLLEKSKELCRQTKGCGIMLETTKSNLIGNNLYPKAGFILEDHYNYYEWENDPLT